MKRIGMLIVIALVATVVSAFAAACGSGSTTPPASDKTPAVSAPQTSQSSEVTETTEAAETTESTSPNSEDTVEPADLPVFAPHELLSAEEAGEISGFPTTMDEGSLYEDPDTGTISERYSYDIDGTGIRALVEIHQDGSKSADDLAEGWTALADFEFNQDLLKDEITSQDVGEQAFTLDSTGQLHMYYQGYYIVVAFEADEYDSSKAAPLNILLGKRIVTNLQEALQ
jgi:hypothetical protein